MRASDLRKEIVREMVVRENIVRILWHVVQTGRHAFSDELSGVEECIAVVPLKAGGTRFKDPNSIAADIIEEIDENKSNIDTLLQDQLPFIKKYCFVILAKINFDYPQISSIVSMPAWLPQIGGQQHTLLIENSGEAIHVQYDHDAAEISDMQRLLLQVELRMRAAMMLHSQRCPPLAKPLFGLIRRRSDAGADLVELIKHMRSYRSSDRGLRPGVREGDSLVSRFVGLCSSASPDKVQGEVVEAVRKALIQDAATLEHRLEYSIIGRVYRATQRPPKAVDAYIQGMLSTIYVAYNLITLAHHANEYEQVSVESLRAVSSEVRRGLASACRFLQACEDEASRS